MRLVNREWLRQIVEIYNTEVYFEMHLSSQIAVVTRLYLMKDNLK